VRRTTSTSQGLATDSQTTYWPVSTPAPPPSADLMRGGFFQPWEIDVHLERPAEHGVRAWHAIALYEQRSPCLTLGLATMIFDALALHGARRRGVRPGVMHRSHA
jgi:hypothetical protein